MTRYGFQKTGQLSVKPQHSTIQPFACSPPVSMYSLFALVLRPGRLVRVDLAYLRSRGKAEEPDCAFLTGSCEHSPIRREPDVLQGVSARVGVGVWGCGGWRWRWGVQDPALKAESITQTDRGKTVIIQYQCSICGAAHPPTHTYTHANTQAAQQNSSFCMGVRST
jgi:hypothetical protein